MLLPATRRRLTQGALFALWLGSTAPALHAEAAMVADLGNVVPHSYADWIYAATAPVALDGVAYFHSNDGVHGRELWRSDGTAGGTARLIDLCPGTCGTLRDSDLRQIAVAGDRLLFAGDDGVHGVELWTSDGTAGGTRLVRDLRPGLAASRPAQFTTVGDRVFFWANDGFGSALWTTDGTAGGTVRVIADPRGGSRGSADVALALGELLIFGYGSSWPDTPGLWRSDGTPEGTFQLSPVATWQQNFGINAPFQRLGSRIVFRGDDPDGEWDPTLWVTDGTVEGTTELAPIRDPEPFAAGANFVFLGARNDEGYAQLWRTDGTPAATELLYTHSEWGASIRQAHMAASGDRLLFSLFTEEHGVEPWIWDGSESRLLGDLRPGPDSSVDYDNSEPSFFASHPLFTAHGDHVHFFANDGVHGFEPWRTDGTPEGTVRLADLTPGAGDSFLDFFQGVLEPPSIGDALLVRLSGPGGSRLLARIGEEESETNVVRVLESATSSFEPSIEGAAPYGSMPLETCFEPVGASLLVQAIESSVGFEPHVLDTASLAVDLLADLYPSVSGGPSIGCRAVGGVAVFAAVEDFSNSGSLYATSGAPGDLTALAEPTEGLGWGPPTVGWARHGDDLVLASGAGLWRTNGTPAGTMSLGVLPDFSPYELESLEGSVLVAGGELGRSDGTPEGLELLLGDSNDDYPYPERLVELGIEVLFLASSEATGSELWATDGTAAGTRLVLDILPGPGSSSGLDYFSWRRDLLLGPVALGSIALFTADDGVHGEELWRSDGTFEGTFLVSDLINGPYPSAPRELVRLGSHVYFVAETHGKGRELWRTDGTESGTELVADLVPGARSSLPENLHAAGSELYFSAWTPARGREAWRIRADGSASPQPVPMDEIAAGALSSSPQIFREIGGAVFTVANDNLHGFELWRLREADVVFSDDFEGTTTRLWSVTAPAE